MLFRPSFCSNCGEKIDRSEWHLWTSRRFCDLCVTELPLHEFAPKVLLGTAALATIVGFGSYLKSGQEKAEVPVIRQKAVENTNVVGKINAPTGNTVVSQDMNPVNPAATQPTPRTLAAISPVKPDQSVKPSAEEQIYFCGAQTKKGTPCSRRVKGNVRCYQHQGMPAMVPANKLKVS